MPESSNSELLSKAAELVRTTPLDSELRLLLIELMARMDDKRLKDLMTIVEKFQNDAEKDNEKLKKSLEQIKDKYRKKTDQLADGIEQELTKLEGEIFEEEKEGRIEDVKKKIEES